VRKIFMRARQRNFREVCWLRFLLVFQGAAVRVEKSSAAVAVSVVIPTRNRPELLSRAVASALRQTMTSLEVIVVIDGEDRQASNQLGALSDPRLHVIALEIGVGGAEARNIGVASARGEWIAFLDDDDEWLPHKLARQIEAGGGSLAMWPVLSSRMMVQTLEYEFAAPLRFYDPEKSVSEFLFCRRSLHDGPFAMQTSTLMMRRDLMLKLPFRAHLKRHQDWDWVLRAGQVNGVEFTVIEGPLVIYRTEDERSSVGRAQDWEFSMMWAAEMRPYFSPRAYAWFLASECASRAVKSRAGFRVYAEIVRRFFLEGRPCLRSACILAGFWTLPRSLRESCSRFIRRWRRNTGMTMSALKWRHGNAGE
jgi:glycosyltransferase involved in cell wall biosynthesis